MMLRNEEKRSIMSYRIYTTDHDEIASAEDVLAQLRPHGRAQGETDWTEKLASAVDSTHPACELTPAEARHLREGRAAILSILQGCNRDIPVTFLLDNSGSMRGRNMMALVQSMSFAGNLLEEAGIPFEILGYTTRSWRGGRPWQEWREETKGEDPRNIDRPGRLNELRHVVFKEIDAPWDIQCLRLLMVPDYSKENIDGEALAWARERIAERGGPGSIVFVNDGAPVDNATNAANGETFLRAHALAEHDRIMGDPSVRMSTVTITPSQPFYPDAVMVDLEETDVRGFAIPLIKAVAEAGLAVVAAHDTDLEITPA
ncbi:hypothetical protein LAZ40_04440 [Cereibacter sphaeroides]|uniref:cobaltochelatase CobT-related protein n=1 Tax=Cereibacter sphaeroides TaxID=1063 RepID=UPI001F26DCF4|nr:hypothetical protein [Cereibacter sphaeroides]MCE6958304.1 hypothetical protein [Cereibacter sphaeroides]MCE6971914.1 hypothetical protein [Cereibacter sphaeroides]